MVLNQEASHCERGRPGPASPLEKLRSLDFASRRCEALYSGTNEMNTPYPPIKPKQNPKRRCPTNNLVERHPNHPRVKSLELNTGCETTDGRWLGT